MVDNFSVKRNDKEDISILRLAGFLDANTIPQFEAAIQELIDAQRYKIITDLRDLTYISSAGLGVYMGFIEDVREAGGDIKLCNLQEKIFKIFDQLGFPRLFDISSGEEDCTDKFNGAG
jgi:anti-sigma B factor antagonist